jgi:hypothetical protein
VCDCSDQAAHYHNLGPKLGASLLTRHIGWKQKKKERKKAIHFCGTVRANWKGMSSNFGKKLRLKQLDIMTRVKDDLTAIVWKDR